MDPTLPRALSPMARVATSATVTNSAATMMAPMPIRLKAAQPRTTRQWWRNTWKPSRAASLGENAAMRAGSARLGLDGQRPRGRNAMELLVGDSAGSRDHGVVERAEDAADDHVGDQADAEVALQRAVLRIEH